MSKKTKGKKAMGILLRLLLIDDNPDDRALIIRSLKKEFDIQVEEIMDAGGFAEALEKGNFDVVITDYQLRWSNGLKILKKIKSRYPDCPVLMFTATGDEETAVEAMRNGLDDYILKSPKHFIRLPSAVHVVLKRTEEITKRKKAEKEKERLQAQLIQAEKMAGIGTLTSGIAHEFNNLLQIMSGHTEYAQRTKKPEDIEEALDIVVNISDRVFKIIRDLLAFSGKETPKKEICHVSELIEAVLSLTEEQLKKNNIDVLRKYEKTPKVEINKGEMQQVFLNMVTNARDAMLPKGGKLEIRVNKVKGNIEISFADQGRGIEEENIGKVFEPFYTTKGAVGGDSRIQGIGLGLSVSYGIVQRHGGTIKVESEKGKGTTFTVKLPVKKAQAEKVKPKPEEKKTRKTKPLNILVVDDEEGICQMFTKWLSAEGHRVKSALNGEKALNLFRKEQFDVVFLDVIMPGIPSLLVLGEMKKIFQKTRVVTISGRLLDKEFRKELKLKGTSQHLQKPIKIEDINNCLASLEV